MLHAFTGCDVVSFFCGRGKKSAWDAWRVCPTMTTVFMQLADLPTQVSEESLREIERFVVVLYDRTSALSSVNEARQKLFSRGSRSLENIPPTQAALVQHTRRAAYQAGHVWATCLQREPQLPSPSDWGWTNESSRWEPVWSDLSQAQKTFYELIKCNCKKVCHGLCKCSKANLK